MIEAVMYKGQHVAVFGLGKSGMSTVRSLVNGKAHVYAYDDSQDMREQLSACQLQHVYVTDPTSWDWKKMAALVLSPGIPLFYPTPHPVVKQAQAVHCPIISDNEVLYAACPAASYVGITGTNGKSTTTSLIYHLLHQAGHQTQIGGNIGIPVLSLNPMKAPGIFVLELSSYQLDLSNKMHCEVGVILNVTPDHLDRHNTMQEYITAKQRIFRHQTSGNKAIIGVDDAYGVAMVEALKTQSGGGLVIPISSRKRQPGGVSVLEGVIYDDMVSPKTIPIGTVDHLKGEHNAQNIAAAYAAVKHFGIGDGQFIAGLRSFVGLDHRMQYMGVLGNVTFYNDSKATNADATAKALTVSDHVFWIAGGQAKAGGITSLESYFPHVKHAYLIGDAQEDFARTLEGKVAYTKSGTLEKAVEQATRAAMASAYRDAVVLLSPACASFDQFQNFMVRGERFGALVQALGVKK